MAVCEGTLLSFVLIIVVFQCVQVQIASAVGCTFVQGSTCKCTLDDGSGEIDLTPLFAGGAKSVFHSPFTYTYDACKTVPCADKCSTEEGCLACQDGGGDNKFGIASVKSATMGDVTKPGYTFTMTYSNAAQGKNSKVDYTLDASGGSQFTFVKEDPSNNYELAMSGCFTTPTTNCGATPSPSGGGGGVEAGWVGFVLISLAIIAVVLYFAIGMPIMYFVKGARGVEMIPLITFWKDFPFLLKDGFMFTIFGWPCCANMRPNAYSKI